RTPTMPDLQPTGALIKELQAKTPAEVARVLKRLRGRGGKYAKLEKVLRAYLRSLAGGQTLPPDVGGAPVEADPHDEAAQLSLAGTDPKREARIQAFRDAHRRQLAALREQSHGGKGNPFAQREGLEVVVLALLEGLASTDTHAERARIVDKLLRLTKDPKALA